jgi:hypothetical protein
VFDVEQKRLDLLRSAGHRKISIDLNQLEMQRIHASRQINGRSKASYLVLKGEDPEKVGPCELLLTNKWRRPCSDAFIGSQPWQAMEFERNAEAMTTLRAWFKKVRQRRAAARAALALATSSP